MAELRVIKGGALGRPVLTPEQREAIAGQIETLIAFLDLADGDPDLEPEEDMDPAGDDGCGPIMYGRGVTYGSPHDEPYRGVMLPRYGIDQRRGPINEREAHEACLRSVEG